MRAAATRIRVRSLEHLKALCENGSADFVIALGGGARSSKHISWDGEEFAIFSGISGTFRSYTPESLQESFVGIAIESGALYTDI
ncbi:MAG TPA: hypothetical protein PK609_00970 [Candidatus Paceibacterota bacterium]|nr:hypothetical protein [Candidatus Paceibacterota bacterium]